VRSLSIRFCRREDCVHLFVFCAFVLCAVRSQVSALTASRRLRLIASVFPVVTCLWAAWPFLLARASYLYVSTHILLGTVHSLGFAVLGSQLRPMQTTVVAPSSADPSASQMQAQPSDNKKPQAADGAADHSSVQLTHTRTAYRVIAVADRAAHHHKSPSTVVTPAPNVTISVARVPVNPPVSRAFDDLSPPNVVQP
jgi:hypothetical protein